ncbi:MAG: hypothetical protein MI808_14755 [Pseudomonadales bacterium]|nr:hypothetical protein [Pseudomonadales bacterium]
MKRLYYLFSGTQYAKSISDDLINSGIDEGQLHFMNKDVAALEAQHVHRTNILDEKDIQHSGTYGALIGAGVGLLFTFYLLATDLGTFMTFPVFLFVCTIFTFFGAWSGGMVGISNDNHHVARFHDAIEQGDTLLMLDAFNDNEEDQLKEVMHSRHMEASYEGEEKDFKTFF